MCTRRRGCTVREDAAPALAEGSSWSRVGDRINIIDRDTLTEERICSTTHKYLLSAYYGPGTVLRGLSMITPLLIIQIGSMRRDGSSWKAGRLWLGKAGREKGMSTMASLGERCQRSLFAPLVPTGLLRSVRLEPQQHPHRPVLKGRCPFLPPPTVPLCPRGCWSICRAVSHPAPVEQESQG